MQDKSIWKSKMFWGSVIAIGVQFLQVLGVQYTNSVYGDILKYAGLLLAAIGARFAIGEAVATNKALLAKRK